MISKSITPLTSQKIVYTNLLAEVTILKSSLLLIFFLSKKNFHSPMNVDQKHVVFRQELYHCTLFHPH